MSNRVDPQVDLGVLSLNGLGAFSNVLATLSADDVQPVALLQLEQLGAAFPISGPLRAQVPNHLQRCKSTRLDRLGVMIGWRKGDAASLMAHSASGQAIALLATCLENTYGINTTATIFYQLSKSILPNAVRLSSPQQMAQATEILSRKLGLIGYGSILAKHVCRIYEVYQQQGRKAPLEILTPLGQDGVIDILSKISQALREDAGQVRIRGCLSMGYIMALAVTLFSDDCIVTVESLIIHQGCHSFSISIDVTDSLGERSLEVRFMEKIESLRDIPVKPVLPSRTLKFSYPGHFAAFTQLHLQETGLVCSTVTLEAIGTCILSLSDLIMISHGERSGSRSICTTNFFETILGDNPRATIHRRCELALGVFLPLKWPAFSDSLQQLKDVIAKSNHENDYRQLVNGINAQQDPTDALLRIIDEGVASLAVEAHDGAVWQEQSDHETWHPSDEILNRGVRSIVITPREVLYKLFSWDDGKQIVRSEGTTTLIPAGILHLGGDLKHNRGMELLDGLIHFENRYHRRILTQVDYNLCSQRPHQPVAHVAQTGTIFPSRDGVHSDLSLAVGENVHGLTLECVASFGGQRQTIDVRERVDQLFGLLDADHCRHPRKTSLKQEYVTQVRTNSVLSPDQRSGEQLSIVQTHDNSTAQFLSLTRWEPAILCRKCCLNCAYEQAREKDIYKIIVA